MCFAVLDGGSHIYISCTWNIVKAFRTIIEIYPKLVFLSIINIRTWFLYQFYVNYTKIVLIFQLRQAVSYMHQHISMNEFTRRRESLQPITL